MKKVIEYRGRNYNAWVSEWTSGESTATIRIGRNEILLHWSSSLGWYRK